MKKFPIYVITVAGIVLLFFFYSLCILKFSVKVDETVIKSPSIPLTFDGVRMIQISDTLIENEEDLSTLEKAVNEINRLQADIVIFTGDLFPKGTVSSSLVTQTESLLSSIKTSLAKVAILGDQDLENEETVTTSLQMAGFKVLKDESISLYNGSSESITFIGVNSLVTTPALKSILTNNTNSNTFNIMLLHEPTLAAMMTDYPIELQLSGHCRGISTTSSNNGAKYCEQFYDGTYRFADRLTLHVNQGLNRPNETLSLLKRPTIQSFLLIKEK